MKTNKSFSSRIKVTKNGKLLRRPAGLNHFNAKCSPKKRMQKRGLKQVSINQRTKRRFLPATE